ncbi:D-aminoacyl-tRNA deacylase [Acetivibrio mesophilus]|uniref:D-aminoacyl-tRNA deacylase n=1 Tax=Acetivibrio mesophilus TaxID=2487273 RepID=A0A4Q0I391_9FIRM|nr:D-aminoacyl-tRNA deacylase [Acetivibrio mesophilus]ODM24860.1 D-tyrosyl-tRNA(Tyr) deacylase [Clostridium sp. Bc-iso-3]RXE58696.1 D-tyrosyl-tRNA(Tyr) deacylase [Acetivibrio mesophilus]HHV29387.1 D-tyrosyl-tRNA(Tyr) deacylase [Clostridium sp.]
MRAVVQRVTASKVTVEGEITGEIGKGLMVLLGVGCDDSEKDVGYLADKIVNLRIFEDENGKMNLSLKDVGGELLVVSQFTLYGDCRKGKRPGFDKAARPEAAKELYEKFVQECQNYGVKVETGRFQAMMMVEIHNDGPVTMLIDSKKEF